MFVSPQKRYKKNTHIGNENNVCGINIHVINGTSLFTISDANSFQSIGLAQLILFYYFLSVQTIATLSLAIKNALKKISQVEIFKKNLEIFNMFTQYLTDIRLRGDLPITLSQSLIPQVPQKQHSLHLAPLCLTGGAHSCKFNKIEKSSNKSMIIFINCFSKAELSSPRLALAQLSLF